MTQDGPSGKAVKPPANADAQASTEANATTDADAKPRGKREKNQAIVDAKIRACARAELATAGPVALSMRAIAREAGMASSAIYRYYPTREALLTALIVESYAELAATLEAVTIAPGLHPERLWTLRANALRDWALANPHQFQLIYGTPIPDYQAPPETIPVAERVARCFLQLAPTGPTDPAKPTSPTDPADSTAPAEPAQPVDEKLARQLEPLGGAPAAAILGALSQIIGFISLELAGHFAGTADPADLLWAHVIRTQVRTIGLAAD